ncbi:MAG: TldD/PmbA family protein, partial [Alphaproteobacteria bacterium]|nr:TldD/PmbA family protein [Alphaproteobacteria bacterium]
MAQPIAQTPPDQLLDLIAKAKRMGAEAADAILIDSSSLSVSWRNGQIESVENAESADLGLRVLIGKKQAMAATTDRRPQSLDELAERAVAMARAAPEDPYCGLAAPEEIATAWPKLELADAHEISAPALIDMAREAEEAALSVKGVAQCESTDAGAGHAAIVLAASNGFLGRYRRTSFSLSASVLAGEGLGMERDYDFASVVFHDDLPSATKIGRRAAERAIRNLGARKMPTCHVPVVFDPREANSLLGHFSSAISGSSVARGTSFLKDYLSKKVFADSVIVTDDPFRARGLRSHSFDAEGLLPVKRKIIDQGLLTTWFMDLRSARQLGMKSTAHASRSPGGVPSPSPSNLYIEPGKLNPAELMRDIKQGFYVTELMGSGVNGVTGD